LIRYPLCHGSFPFSRAQRAKAAQVPRIRSMFERFPGAV
jgi:hypothetical protein